MKENVMSISQFTSDTPVSQRRAANEHHAFVSPRGVSASPAVKVYGGIGLSTSTRESVRDASGGPARKTLIATYPSSGFIAERNEDGSLSVYRMTGELVSTETIGDAKRMTPARLAVRKGRRAVRTFGVDRKPVVGATVRLRQDRVFREQLRTR
jgi:hypothetical protein